MSKSNYNDFILYGQTISQKKSKPKFTSVNVNQTLKNIMGYENEEEK